MRDPARRRAAAVSAGAPAVGWPGAGAQRTASSGPVPQGKGRGETACRRPDQPGGVPWAQTGA